jgi:hypothetical protein
MFIHCGAVLNPWTWSSQGSVTGPKNYHPLFDRLWISGRPKEAQWMVMRLNIVNDIRLFFHVFLIKIDNLARILRLLRKFICVGWTDNHWCRRRRTEALQISHCGTRPHSSRPCSAKDSASFRVDDVGSQIRQHFWGNCPVSSWILTHLA